MALCLYPFHKPDNELHGLNYNLGDDIEIPENASTDQDAGAGVYQKLLAKVISEKFHCLYLGSKIVAGGGLGHPHWLSLLSVEISSRSHRHLRC